MNYKNKEVKENNFGGLVAKRNTRNDYTEKRKQTNDRKEMAYKTFGCSFKIIKIGNVFEFLMTTTDDNGKDKITRIIVKQNATTEENKSTLSYLNMLKKDLEKSAPVSYNSLELLVNSVIESKSDIDLFYRLLYVMKVKPTPFMDTVVSSKGKGSIEVKYNYQRLGFASDYDMIDQLRIEWLSTNDQSPDRQPNHYHMVVPQPFNMNPMNSMISCGPSFNVTTKGILVSKLINLLSIDYMKYLDWEKPFYNAGSRKPLIHHILKDSFDKVNSLLFVEEKVMTEKFISLGFINNTFNKRYFSNYIINSLLGNYVGDNNHAIIPNYGTALNKNDRNQLILSFNVRDEKLGIITKDYLLVYEWENIPNTTYQRFRVDLTLQNPEDTVKK